MGSECYTPKPLAASGVVFAGIGKIGGFLCSTAGTIVVRDGPLGTSSIVVASMPVTAGVWHAMPFSFGSGCWIDLAGGATGTVGIA